MSQTMDGPAPVKNGNEEDGIAMNEGLEMQGGGGRTASNVITGEELMDRIASVPCKNYNVKTPTLQNVPSVLKDTLRACMKGTELASKKTGRPNEPPSADEQPVYKRCQDEVRKLPAFSLGHMRFHLKTDPLDSPEAAFLAVFRDLWSIERAEQKNMEPCNMSDSLIKHHLTNFDHNDPARIAAYAVQHSKLALDKVVAAHIEQTSSLAGTATRRTPAAPSTSRASRSSGATSAPAVAPSPNSTPARRNRSKRIEAQAEELAKEWHADMSVCSVREHLLQAKERAGEFSAEAQELDQLLQVTDKKMLEFNKIVLQASDVDASKAATWLSDPGVAEPTIEPVCEDFWAARGPKRPARRQT